MSPAPPARWAPSVTVAAVIERQGRYLVVEEHTPEGLRLNNPAGHLEPGESLPQACAREALEETGHPFEPLALVGVYQARMQRVATGEDISYLRFAFSGRLGERIADRTLDEGIVRTLWMSLQELQDSRLRHRSPLLLQCALDHASGRRFALEMLHSHDSIWQA